MNGVALQCKRSMIDKIRALPMVKHVSIDREVKADLTQSVHQIRADIVQDSLGYTGKGVLVGHIDTGIDYNNPALGGGFGPSFRVIGGYDFSNNDSNPMDDNGHGTHVAGIIGANGGDSLRGVAPGVKFLAVKVLDANGSGLMSTIIAGIDYCLDPDGNPATDDAVDIINMSLGGQPSSDSPMDIAVENATKAGILCVVAAGNDGNSGYGTISSPGTSESALTVGACDSTFQIASFSSLGPIPIHSLIKPEVVAPGVAILSTILNNQTESMSGTSMATPHATGEAALLKQEHPSWTPAELKAAIVNSARPEGNDVSIFAQGKGCIDALDAANIRMIVEPGVMGFGSVDLAQDVWKDTVKLTVENFRSVSQNTKISVADGLISGATLTFDKTSFSLAPGEQTTISAVLSVPSSVPVLQTEPFAYLGKIKVTSDSDNVIVPFSFLKSTTLVITFDLQPDVLFLVDRTGGTFKQVEIQEGSKKYIVPILQGDTLDVLAMLHQYSPKFTDLYLVHQKIDNPNGLTYALMTHDQATINMIDDSVYDIHNNMVVLDSNSLADVDCQVAAYDETFQLGLGPSCSFEWTIVPNEQRLFFPPLDSLSNINKIIIAPRDSDYYIFNKYISGLQTRQDIDIATGADNLIGYHISNSYIDPHLPNPSSKNDLKIIIESDTWRTSLTRRGLMLPYLQSKSNLFFNKPGVNQFKNNQDIYNFDYIGVGYNPITGGAMMRTPEFTINDKGEAVFEQMKAQPEISTSYIYETMKPGDTLKIEQNAHLNFPDYMTTQENGSILIKCNSDLSSLDFTEFNGGLKQFNGVIEYRTPTPWDLYWGIPLFTAQAFAHNRFQINMKPFIPTDGYSFNTIYAYYEFDNVKNTNILQVISDTHPYSILGQAGQCTEDCEYWISRRSNTIFPSFNLLQASVDGKAVDVVRPDQNGIIRLLLFNPNNNIASVSISLLLASGDEIALPVSNIGNNEYDAPIPANIPTGFIDIAAGIEDASGNQCKLTASPGFYFGSAADKIKLDARLKMASYSLNNVEDITMQAGDTLNYNISYANFGSDIARNIVVTFPATPYFQPLGSQSWSIDSLAAGDTVNVPVQLRFLGKQQSTDIYTHYSPSITWTSGVTNYLRKQNVFVDFQNTITGVAQTAGTIPNRFELYQNYPNPFNPSTTIRYDLPEESRVKIVVYDILGREITTLVNKEQKAGSYRVIWNANRYASGIYFYRIQAGNYSSTKKLLLLK